jgi:DNA-binding SARP family transcriptional activator
LNNLLWRLRSLADGRLLAQTDTTLHTIRWQVPVGSLLDLSRFDQLLTDGEGLAAREQAAALYRGPLLADCEATWCLAQRQRYAERWYYLLEELVRGYEKAGNNERALQYALQLVQAAPEQAFGHEAVIRLNLALARPQAAQAAYQQYADYWQREWGLPPATTMRRLLTEAETAVSVPAYAHTNVTALARMTQQVWQTVTQAHLPPALVQVMEQSAQTLYQTLAAEMEKIGQTADAELAWEVAGHAYQTALAAVAPLPSAADRLARQFELHLRLDTVYDRLEQRQEQAENLTAALAVAEKLADPTRQSEIMARRCWLALESLALAEAQTHGQQALRLLGTTYELLGHYQTALDHHQQALTLDRDDPDQRRLDHNNLASVYTWLGRDWLALQQAAAALELTPAQPSSLVRCIVLGNLANIKRELGEYDEAAENLLAARHIAALLGARELLAWLQLRGAALWRQMGDRERAWWWAREGWQMSQTGDYGRYALEAALELARLAGLSTDFATARRWLAQVETLLTELGLTRYQGSLSLLTGLCELQCGDLAAAHTQAVLAIEAAAPGREERLLPAAHSLAFLITRKPDSQQRAAQALQQRAAAIPDPNGRTRFEQATPLRRQLQQSQPVTPEAIWLE